MKNSGILRRLRYLTFFALAGVFSFSCGLDTVIYIKGPEKYSNRPSYNDTEFLNWYCSFYTEEESNNSADSTFSGTSIYYKIYNNYDTLNTEKSSILGVNTESNGSAAAKRMIESGSGSYYGYQTLCYKSDAVTDSDSKTVFSIDNANQNRYVAFRPKTYTGSENYFGETLENFRACIKIKNNYLAFLDGNYKTLQSISYDSTAQVWKSGDTVLDNANISFALPCRYNGKTFDFFNSSNIENSELNVEPEQDSDSDYKHSESSSEDNAYYIQFFAVGVAFDTDNVQDAYSLVLDLGSVPVKKD